MSHIKEMMKIFDMLMPTKLDFYTRFYLDKMEYLNRSFLYETNRNIIQYK